MDSSQPEAIALVESGLTDAEEAIKKHPPETVKVYYRVVASSEVARKLHPHSEELVAHLKTLGITVAQYDAIHRYLLAMGFMAAWYHRHADSARRDQAAQSAATLAAATGVDSPEAVFKLLLDHEQMFRKLLAQEGIGANQGCAPMLLLAATLTAVLSVVRS